MASVSLLRIFIQVRLGTFIISSLAYVSAGLLSPSPVQEKGEKGWHCGFISRTSCFTSVSLVKPEVRQSFVSIWREVERGYDNCLRELVSHSQIRSEGFED